LRKTPEVNILARLDLAHNAAMAEPPRGFPSPWRADTMPGGYVVRDANGQALAYVCSRANEAEALLRSSSETESD
jgi:hypothetical protein